MSTQAYTGSPVYTIKIYHDDGSRLKHVLAVRNPEQQICIINALKNNGAKPDGDWYLCPTTYVVDFAKFNSRIRNGLIYDLHTTVGISTIAPFIELTNVHDGGPKRLYAFKEQDQRDAFLVYITKTHGFTSDVDWSVAPSSTADAAAVDRAKCGVTIFELRSA